MKLFSACCALYQYPALEVIKPAYVFQNPIVFIVGCVNILIKINKLFFLSF